MATMVRVKTTDLSNQTSNNPFLASTIPAPFPRELLVQNAEAEPQIMTAENNQSQAGPSHAKESSQTMMTGTAASRSLPKIF